MSPFTLLIGLILATAAVDPRPELVDLHLYGEPGVALQHVETLDEETARDIDGIAFLEAQLLLAEGKQEAGLKALEDTMTSAPQLAPWALLRLAQEHDKAGRSAVAAGLAARLLGSSPPGGLVKPAVALLERSLEQSGDCRLLNGLTTLRLKAKDKRLMLMARASCARRDGRTEEEKVILTDLLRADTRDDVAHRAAEQLLPLVDLRTLKDEPLVDLGTAFFHHRDFDVSRRLLKNAADRFDAVRVGRPVAPHVSPQILFDSRYALARSHFWLRRYDQAAQLFSEAAPLAPKKSLRAKSIYQQARCFELSGASTREAGLGPERRRLWSHAVELFNLAHNTEPTSGWASAALIASVRLNRLLGKEAQAEARLQDLVKTGRADNIARARLFLASSDLVQGRTDRAGAWLDAVEKSGKVTRQEVLYWQGRLAEEEKNLKGAAELYIRAAAIDPAYPFAAAARRRAAGPSVRPMIDQELERLSRSSSLNDLRRAWLWLGDQDDSGRRAYESLIALLGNDPKAVSFLNLALPAVDSWPLWRQPITRADDQLLALGLFAEPGTRTLRHFPVAKPSLAMAGAHALAQGGAPKRSLYVTEILLKQKPSNVDLEILPRAYQELLYPFKYSYLILKEGRKHNVDPFLMAGLIREESRFDADAFSGASARGLTQFIYSTARDIAPRAEIDLRSPRDIHRPEIAIALGAAYLSRLHEELAIAGEERGRREAVVSAYNAGEPQAMLWQLYCYSDEPEEYWSKIAFKETRNYVRRVLRSAAHYQRLYGRGAER